MGRKGLGWKETNGKWDLLREESADRVKARERKRERNDEKERNSMCKMLTEI